MGNVMGNSIPSMGLFVHNTDHDINRDIPSMNRLTSARFHWILEVVLQQTFVSVLNEKALNC